jgi:hypothetical protein
MFNRASKRSLKTGAGFAEGTMCFSDSKGVKLIVFYSHWTWKE